MPAIDPAIHLQLIHALQTANAMSPPGTRTQRRRAAEATEPAPAVPIASGDDMSRQPPRRYTAAEDEQIREGLAAGLNLSQIARRLGRNDRSIGQRVERLGLRLSPADDVSGEGADERAQRIVMLAGAYCRACRDAEEATDEAAIERAMRRVGLIESRLLRACRGMAHRPRGYPLAMAAMALVRALNAQRADPATLEAAYETLMRVWRDQNDASGQVREAVRC
jgi:hypothetical protein